MKKKCLIELECGDSLYVRENFSEICTAKVEMIYVDPDAPVSRFRLLIKNNVESFQTYKINEPYLCIGGYTLIFDTDKYIEDFYYSILNRPGLFSFFDFEEYLHIKEFEKMLEEK